MKLLEFITYCEMRNIVREHMEMPAGFPNLLPTKYYRLHIQARGYTVNIEYTRYKDWTRITQSTIFDHGPSNAITHNATIDKMLEAVSNNYDVVQKFSKMSRR